MNLLLSPMHFGGITASRMVAHRHWWRSIPGVGPSRAARLQRWMQEWGLVDQVRDLVVRTAPTAIVWDAGSNRSDQPSVLGTQTDLHAVQSWLAGYTGHTLRAYRREAERLILWASIERQKPLSGLTRDDLLAYQTFLRDPQPACRWCAPRHTPRNSPAWRPFEGPLSPAAIDYTLSVLSGLFEFLVGSGYLRANPAMRLPRQAKRSLRQQFGRRLLTAQQWSWLRDGVDESTPRGMRLGLMLDLLYATGLRLSEMAAARFEHLTQLDDDADEPGWMLNVLGKGGKWREVPVPNEWVERAHYLRHLRQGDAQRSPLIGPIAGLMGSPDFDPDRPLHVTYIAQEISRHAKKVAAALERDHPEDARRLASVSAHWLRHTHASHALEAGVDLPAVQANLGHASLATTSVYVSAEQRRRIRQMRSFWSAHSSPSSPQEPSHDRIHRG